MAHKIIEEIRYHETVYYDDAGEEVARERIHDDAMYDAEGPYDLTDQEREDWL
jgi:hypothetical protein